MSAPGPTPATIPSRPIRRLRRQQGLAIIESLVDDPLFGRLVVRADGRAIHPMYVFKVKAPEASRGRWDVYDLVETIPAEDAFRPLSDGGCALK